MTQLQKWKTGQLLPGVKEVKEAGREAGAGVKGQRE